MKQCETLDEVRQEIDAVDSELIRLLAVRGRFVKQAARFKQTTNAVKAPERVEQVIRQAKEQARVIGADETVVESVYRAMIAAFIEAEMHEHVLINKK